MSAQRRSAEYDAKKAADAAFEQVFTTLRQKYKAENDAAAASRLKRREDHKALKARRLLRKKTVRPASHPCLPPCEPLRPLPLCSRFYPLLAPSMQPPTLADRGPHVVTAEARRARRVA